MNELENQTSDCCTDLDGIVRENPTRAILFALGAGVALALMVRALQPRPQPRAARLLDDLRERLADLADPAFRRASGLASHGAGLVQDGVDQFSSLHLDRTLNGVTKRIRNLFH